jgi:hypothetical protein
MFLLLLLSLPLLPPCSFLYNIITWSLSTTNMRRKKHTQFITHTQNQSDDLQHENKMLYFFIPQLLCNP